MRSLVNILGALTIGLCALLLLRGFVKVRERLLLWGGLCFTGLALANVLVFVDLALVPEVSLYTWRLGITAVSLLLLIYGLIFESDWR